ncbi:hypothetical protein ACHAWO_004730 [Cyclotella atomus]|jgi:hypothetical protein|uniref:Uncharacterized protein n=1 Tax=Cyclotella atomus TaxID=382360 RepID=A0ABD3QZ20_9STRA
MSGSRLSGLQKEVLALYRLILREAVGKDRKKLAASTPGSHKTVNQLLTTRSSTSYARTEFRKQSQQVRRSDFKTIEYKIRKGKKQLQLLKMPGVNLVGGNT